MTDSAGNLAKGVAAFAVVERLTQTLIDKHVLSKLDVLQALDDIARAAAHRGISQNDQAETSASVLVSGMAGALRKGL